MRLKQPDRTTGEGSITPFSLSAAWRMSSRVGSVFIDHSSTIRMQDTGSKMQDTAVILNPESC
jgi:hypothetical protein